MKKFLLLFIIIFAAQWVSAQTIQVKGVVLSEKTKKPIPDAGVLVLNSNRGTVADSLGKFSILINATDTLLFRAINYGSVIYVAPKQRVNLLSIKIELPDQDIELKEVTITNRPTDEEINRALRNMAPRKPMEIKPNPTVIIEQKNPGAGPPQPNMLNPASMLYQILSDRGKQLKKLREIKEAEAYEEALRQYQQQQEQYNQLFKDNTGYE